MENKEVLTVIDIIEKLRIGRRQAYDLVNSGEFHVIRIGNSIRVHRDVLEMWMKNENIARK
jgi:excisionase family DNA binding protein